jgi:hypothetical protein
VIAVKTQPQNVLDMVVGNPNNFIKDRTPLWRDFKNGNFEHPYMVNI